MTESLVDEAVGFEQFVAERGRGLLRAAWLLTGDHHHAEDLVQTALAKTWGRYAAMSNDHKFEAYVRTTIYRTYVSWWRRMSWRSERPHDDVPDTEAAGGADALRVDLLRALDGLPRMQRAVLTLRFVDDMPTAEVAHVLGIPEGTVKSHSHRGCAALRGSVHLAGQEVTP
ncbi:SigE family RNA polymerase sigma factor [Tessaracoccus antarcticus]|uniref:SigE family RNA polymerase sigma factor n=1 Tax=Tessaracoccus antarcticus TaxID=2479848 RepID=A0A3M0GH39_9ACTN|nr:SigE family RNA polymerase sigma factor [Tessaracoccus antarcticus]RMB62042.1 SigE family RNA polymerase sigma factor [Tessaracoccus antarcticus]